MSLILIFQNDGTGRDKSANYEVTVRINDKVIVRDSFAGHNRKDGWEVLVSKWIGKRVAPEGAT